MELRNVDVDRKDGRYFLTSNVWFDADVESVFAVFLDNDLSENFSSFIVESRNLEPGENGQRRFYIRNEGCVWFYCKSFERTGSVEQASNAAGMGMPRLRPGLHSYARHNEPHH